MSETIVAKRYADALFQLGDEHSQLDQFETELRTLRAVLQDNKKFVTFLKHPRISVDKKKQLISEAFQSFSPVIINTLKLLIDRHREEIFPELAEQFIARMNDAKGIAEADVYSVRELGEEEKKQVSTVFAQKLGKKTLLLNNIVDPSLLGGIKLRVGNRIYDGSVSGKLERIERKLVSAY
ncbi:F0F1 ATP synthase subunit delta [Thalassobacillus sp. CUG 92003]|uniref:F0F1 ATP synthase subunit delta n=1 Tax=Thalassobacillus sp. CUG 92003 TaxID=2736641 RepID=UPI0015E78581|nr:F0F1 ATP synthase subunit delta [Thalassobacillus sp. CUG 92003]